MIGILCSDGAEREYADVFYSLFKKIGSRRDDNIVVFMISNIDFPHRRVIGSLVTGKVIEKVQVALPSVIFNLSLQRNAESIKARKELVEMSCIKLINDINRYDQHMIMDILYSSKATNRYVLPYHVYNKAIRDYKPNDNQAYITMPARGASISRAIYTEPKEDSDIVKGTQYFRKGQICDYIDASLCQSQWIFVEVPNLMIQHNHPIILRSYLQKVSLKSWKVLQRKIYPEEATCSEGLMKKTDAASLVLIDYINNFLPAIGIAFIDFILGSDGCPYFLHLGGFEQDFFDKKDSESCHKRFYKNLFSLASDYKRMQKED